MWLDVDDLAERDERLVVTVRRSKKGALFRAVHRSGTISDTRLTDRAVALVVKRSAERAGLDSVAGHFLRAGLITAVAEAGVHERDIMAHS